MSVLFFLVCFSLLLFSPHSAAVTRSQSLVITMPPLLPHHDLSAFDSASPSSSSSSSSSSFSSSPSSSSSSSASISLSSALSHIGDAIDSFLDRQDAAQRLQREEEALRKLQQQKDECLLKKQELEMKVCVRVTFVCFVYSSQASFLSLFLILLPSLFFPVLLLCLSRPSFSFFILFFLLFYFLFPSAITFISSSMWRFDFTRLRPQKFVDHTRKETGRTHDEATKQSEQSSHRHLHPPLCLLRQPHLPPLFRCPHHRRHHHLLIRLLCSPRSAHCFLNRRQCLQQNKNCNTKSHLRHAVRTLFPSFLSTTLFACTLLAVPRSLCFLYFFFILSLRFC